MNRQEIIQQHLNNTFVYIRRQGSPVTVERVDASSEGGRDQQYRDDVLTSVKKQLEQVPEDILLASGSSMLPVGTTHEPMAIIVLESDEDAYISEAEKAVIWNMPDRYVQAMGGFLTSAIADHGLRQEWAARTGNLMFAYRPSLPLQGTEAFAPEVTAQQDRIGHTLVHEFGHYYLNCCLTKQEKEEFLSALTGAITQDTTADATAISSSLIQYVQKRKQSHPALDSREEYFSYLLQQLSGGKSRFDLHDNQKMFELDRCKNLLNCVSHYHPSWKEMIQLHVPSFGVAENSQSWGEGVRATKRGRIPGE